VVGENYYRVRSVAVNGEAKYTGIAKVQIGKGAGGFVIYPTRL
jgi:hypothetical protein